MPTQPCPCESGGPAGSFAYIRAPALVALQSVSQGFSTTEIQCYNSCVTLERIERFFKNLASALGHCISEDAEVLGIAIPALVCVGILWLIGVAIYDFILDPHVTTAALDSLSINPDKWISR
jgi:hypothetical protein